MLVAAGIMLVALCLAGRWPRLSRREWLTVALVGVAGNAAFHLCLVGGLALTTPAHSALLVNLTPLFATLLAGFAGGAPRPSGSSAASCWPSAGSS